MKKWFKIIISKIFPSDTFKREAEYSVKKYKKTYKLLEEYDAKNIRNPEDLAEPGRLRKYLQ